MTRWRTRAEQQFAELLRGRRLVIAARLARDANMWAAERDHTTSPALIARFDGWARDLNARAAQLGHRPQLNGAPHDD
jgi:hypothetical protein